MMDEFVLAMVSGFIALIIYIIAEWLEKRKRR